MNASASILNAASPCRPAAYRAAASDGPTRVSVYRAGATPFHTREAPGQRNYPFMIVERAGLMIVDVMAR